MNNVYKKVELVRSSRSSIEDAITDAVSGASTSLRSLDWFEVRENRGWIRDGEVQHFQTILGVGFRIEVRPGPGDDATTPPESSHPA